MTGLRLSPIGSDIVRRGGEDGQTTDGMLILEIMKRAPGLEKADLERVFIAIMEEYGESAMQAIREGYVQFEERPGGTRDGGGTE